MATKNSTNSTKSPKSGATTKAAKEESTAKTSKSGAGSKKSSKKNQSKLGKVLSGIITAVVIILAVLWYFGGKPTIEVGAEGITLVQQEEPLYQKIYKTITGEYSPEVIIAEINGTGENAQVPNAKGEAATTVAEAEKSTSKTSTTKASGTKSGSGTTGSNPKADQGHPENDPLYLGNPTDAFADTSKNTNFLMVKDQYTLSYNTQTLCPNWVAWHLDTSNMGDADRMDDFRPDDALPEGWYGVKKADYQYNKYGFDRGHVCPSADRTTTKNDNSMTFLMTNMVPQSPDNNRIIWMHFECYERDLAKEGNELYIIAGPYGTGGTSGKGTFNEIPITLKTGETLNMNVPSSTWKVVLAIPEGKDDIKRMSGAKAIAINVPNEMGMQKTGDWEQFICTIDDIEAMTGYDFFELLPDDIEDKLEASKYVYSK